MKIVRTFWLFVLLVAMTIPLTKSTFIVFTPEEKAQQITHTLEFDYVTWTLDAAAVKTGEAGISVSQRLTPAQQHQLVVRYFELVRELESVKYSVQVIYADPRVSHPEVEAKEELTRQEELQSALQRLDPDGGGYPAAAGGRTHWSEWGSPGWAKPFLRFCFTPLPHQNRLITSPRDKIVQDVNLSLMAELTLEETNKLEDQIEASTGESALVVGTGGIGVYPTMIMRTSDLRWVVNTIAHEWTHNYLSLRALGLNYETTPELRIMNETTASIAGNEIGEEVLKTYYPELAAGEENSVKLAAPIEDDAFNFQAEMHETRITVDEMLAQGKVSEAETYMELRRQLFVDHGYLIRKLNQAYFAFYGAYADSPVSAAGDDPVGEAVRQLRTDSSNLAAFIRAMGVMNSYADLQKAVGSE